MKSWNNPANYLVLSVMLLLFSCKNETTGQEALRDSSDGLWMNQTFVDSMAGIQSAKFVGTGGLAEIYINQKEGRAWLLDGTWEPRCYKVKTNREGFFIYRTKPDSGLTLKIQGKSGRAILPGGRLVRLGRPDTADLISGTGFMTALRNTAGNLLLGGRWKVTYASTPGISGEVVFQKNGTVIGLDPLSKFYEICISGECKRFCDEADLVYMSPRLNEPGGYWHAFKRQGRSLSIWKVKSLEWMSNWPDIQPETLWLRMEWIGAEN